MNTMLGAVEAVTARGGVGIHFRKEVFFQRTEVGIASGIDEEEHMINFLRLTCAVIHDLAYGYTGEYGIWQL